MCIYISNRTNSRVFNIMIKKEYPLINTYVLLTDYFKSKDIIRVQPQQRIIQYNCKPHNYPFRGYFGPFRYLFTYSKILESTV